MDGFISFFYLHHGWLVCWCAGVLADVLADVADVLAHVLSKGYLYKRKGWNLLDIVTTSFFYIIKLSTTS